MQKNKHTQTPRHNIPPNAEECILSLTLLQVTQSYHIIVWFIYTISWSRPTEIRHMWKCQLALRIPSSEMWVKVRRIFHTEGFSNFMCVRYRPLPSHLNLTSADI